MLEDMPKGIKAFIESLQAKKDETNAPLIESIEDQFNALIEQGHFINRSPLENSEDIKRKLIEGLNGDLAREYAAAIQYIQHAATITGPEYFAVVGELLVHADEEIGHAKTIADRIDYLGGMPTVTVGAIKVSQDSREMITQDKVGEEEAIARYQERLTQAKEVNDMGTVEILLSILKDEEEHRNDLMVALGE